VQIAPLVNVEGLLTETIDRPGRVRTDGELLPYMRGLLERVSPHADAFVAEGLPADQLRKLAEEIDRFAAAKDLRAKALQRSAAAAEALRTSQDTARKNIAALEAAAMGIEADHPEILTKLRLAMRVGPRAADAAAASPPGSRGFSPRSCTACRRTIPSATRRRSRRLASQRSWHRGCPPGARCASRRSTHFAHSNPIGRRHG